MALHEWHLQNYAMTVIDAAAINKRDLLDLNPDYQRGLVWTDAQRENLIRSLIEGIPTGIVYRNFRGFKAAGATYTIVDGKQRIDTIRRFYDGELTVPAHWFDDEDLIEGLRPNKHGEEWDAPETWTRVSYLGLSDRGHRRFDMSNLAVYETRQLSREMELALYERVNYGGTPHEPKASIPVVQDGTTYLDATQGLAAGLDPTHLVTPIDNFTPHDDVCRCVYPEKCFCAESLKPTDSNGV